MRTWRTYFLWFLLHLTEQWCFHNLNRLAFSVTKTSIINHSWLVLKLVMLQNIQIIMLLRFFFLELLTDPKWTSNNLTSFELHEWKVAEGDACVIPAPAVSVLCLSTQVRTGLIFLLRQRFCQWRQEKKNLVSVWFNIQHLDAHSETAHVYFHTQGGVYSESCSINQTIYEIYKSDFLQWVQKKLGQNYLNQQQKTWLTLWIWLSDFILTNSERN